MSDSHSQNNEIMIESDGLTKLFGNFPAVQDVTFNCRRGEIVGFLGPNGAGKTTTMRMLTGYMPPTSGEAYIAGFHTIDQTMEARQRLGYMPETVPLYLEMSVENYLAFVGRLRNLDNLWERVDDALEAVDLLDRAETHIGKLSKGMRQRVGLAQALLHDPDVLILDEPTIGLDPAQILEVRQLIRELGERHTILLSTHILSEVEQICNRVIMIIEGRIWADMPMSELQGLGETIVLTLKVANPAADIIQTLNGLPGVHDISARGPDVFSLVAENHDATRIAVAETAVSASWGLLELSADRLNLETIFMNKLKEAELARSVASRKTGEGFETGERVAEALGEMAEEEE